MPTFESLTLQILFYYFCPLNNQQVYHCYIISCTQSVWRKEVWYRFSSKHTHTVRLLTGHPSWPLPPPIMNVLMLPPRSQMLQLSSPHTHTGTRTCQQEPPNIQILHKQRTDRQTLQMINSMSLERLEGDNVNDAWPLIPILTDKGRRYSFLLCSLLVLNNHSAC